MVGNNKNAPSTLKIHRDDGMVLLAINWRDGQRPMEFAGFAIEYQEPGGDRYFPLKNRIGFPGQRTEPTDPNIETKLAPIQSSRWVHFARDPSLTQTALNALTGDR